MITGLYRPGRSAAHSLDPRPKLILLTVLCVSFFLPVPLPLLVPHLILLLLTTALCLGAGEVFRPIRGILPLLILIGTLTPLFYRGGSVLIRVNDWLMITEGGLMETARLFVRFTGITLSFYLFFRTTDLDDFILSLRWFGLPFSAALVVSIAFRYIPTMITSYSNITDAHKLRMAVTDRPSEHVDAAGNRRPAHTRRRVKHPGPFQRFRNLLPVLTSVLICAIKGIPALSMALEMRGFGRKNRRTSYRELKSGAPLLRDFTLSLILAVLFIAAPLLLA